RLKRICHCVWHRNQKNEIGQRKSCCSHPVAPEKEKTARGKTAKKRERQQRELVIIRRHLSYEVGPASEPEKPQTAGQQREPDPKIGGVCFWQLIAPEVKHISGNKRYQ